MQKENTHFVDLTVSSIADDFDQFKYSGRILTIKQKSFIFISLFFLIFFKLMKLETKFRRSEMEAIKIHDEWNRRIETRPTKRKLYEEKNVLLWTI